MDGLLLNRGLAKIERVVDERTALRKWGHLARCAESVSGTVHLCPVIPSEGEAAVVVHKRSLQHGQGSNRMAETGPCSVSVIVLVSPRQLVPAARTIGGNKLKHLYSLVFRMWLKRKQTARHGRLLSRASVGLGFANVSHLVQKRARLLF